VAFHYSLAISWSIRAISKWPFLRAYAGVAWPSVPRSWTASS